MQHGRSLELDEADHEPAERDPLEEEAWQREMSNVANTLCPPMVLMFMRAGAQQPDPPPRALGAVSQHV